MSLFCALKRPNMFHTPAAHNPLMRAYFVLFIIKDLKMTTVIKNTNYSMVFECYIKQAKY